MLQKLLANLDRTSEAAGSLRSLWLAMGLFFAIAVWIEIVQLSRGRSSPAETALPASMLAMSVFFLSRRRPIRLISYVCWVALLLAYFLLRLSKWLT
jgi:hypothetical protein